MKSQLAPKVHLLDPHTINQIAAGEVVERPSSAVKELIENALDADARTIHVRVVDAGQRLIEVRDDGCGMSPEDAIACLDRHATSKIRTIEDLYRATSLGFRGEAIPSIASVSRFRISTGSDDSGRTLIEVEGGRLIKQTTEAGPRGTTVVVEDLFFNTPARLKFQKTQTTELGLISELVARYAVVNPHVRFTLEHGDNVLLESPGDDDLHSALAAVWGRETVRTLIPIETVRDGIRLRGLVSPPHLTRPTRNQQWIFANGRPIKNRALFSAIDTAFRQLTPERRYPIAVLFLDIEPGRVDMNVSPTKSEARFQQEGAIFEIIRVGLKDALLACGMVPSADAIARANEALGRGEFAPLPTYPTPSTHGPLNPEASLFAWQALMGQPATESQPSGIEHQASSPQTILDGLRILGQTQDCFFILAENRSGILIIDQHVAHERILYEMLRAKRGQAAIETQPLLTPVTVELDRRLMEVALQSLDELAGAGFDLAPFGSSSILIRSVPAMLRRESPADTLRDLIEDIAEGTQGSRLSVRENVWVMCSCKMAIKAGERLGLAEMEKLILDLAQTENPYLCPHGRPITIMLSRNDLLRKFKRA